MIPNNQFWFNKGNKPPIPFGTIYSSNNWNNLNDFTVNGITASISSGFINLSGGAGDFVKTLDYNYVTALEKFTIKANVKIISLGTSGFGLGIRSVNTTYKHNLSFQFDGTGKLYIRSHNNAVVADSGASVLLPIVGDIFECTISQDTGQVTVTLKKTTGPAQITLTYNFPSNTPSILLHNIGKFCFYTFDGQQQLQSLDIGTTGIKNAKLAIIGDSKSQGYFASSFVSRYASILSTYYGNTVVFAGGGDDTGNLLMQIPEIISFSPNKLVIQIGSNDIVLGTFQANLTNLYNQLVASGIDTYILAPIPENPRDLRPQLNYIVANFPSSKVIMEVWDDLITIPGGYLLKAIYDSGDGVHPNNAGHAQIAQSIINSNKI